MSRKLLTGMLIVFAALTLQSQQPTRTRPDSTKIDSGIKPVNPTVNYQKVDSTQIYRAKLDSLNTDIGKTVDRIDKKIVQIPRLVERAMYNRSIRNNKRLEFDVATIKPPELPVNVPHVKIDTIIPQHKPTGLFRFLKRKK